VRDRLDALLPVPFSSVLAREERQRKTLAAAINAVLTNPLSARYFGKCRLFSPSSVRESRAAARALGPEASGYEQSGGTLASRLAPDP
jgi:hypothetical protein